MEYTQRDMMRRLPKATHVDRTEFLRSVARSKTVIHVGFVDAGYEREQRNAGSWLHQDLARVAKHIVGVDINERGIRRAISDGYEAYQIDLSDPSADVSQLPFDADVVIAGEVIEHVENVGAFVRGIARVASLETKIVFTTPNSSSILQAVLAFAGREVCHPDHVVSFTPSTLPGLLERCGLELESMATYSSKVRLDTAGEGGRAVALVGRFALFCERILARYVSAHVASGLIVVARKSSLNLI